MHTGRRIAFRFFAVYLVLYNLDVLLGALGKTVQQVLYRQPLRSLDGWLAVHVFGLDQTAVRLGWGGASDVPLYYIHVLVLLVLAAVISLVWSLADRQRGEYHALHSWVRLVVRYALAASLFMYGFSKVFVAQMAPAWMYLERLVEPVGDMSPAGLLWAFVGYSPSYQIFGGLAEVAAGALLLFRRTTTLGALVSIGVLLNVVMLNFGYHVDVKLASMNMLLSAVFLVAPDVATLARFFVFNRPVASLDASDPAVGSTRWPGMAAAVFKVVFATLILYNSISFGYQSALFHPPADRPVLAGLYDVETFVQNGHERPPLTTDPARWKRVAIGDPPTVMHVQLMDSSFRQFNAEYDAHGQRVTLVVGGDPKKKYVLTCSQPDQDHLVMEGAVGDVALSVRMKRIDVFSLSLLSSPFRWTGRTDIH